MVQVFRPVALTLTFPHDLRSKTLLCGFDSGGGCGEKGLGPRCPGECITPGFPFCCSCRPCFPIPSVPQLDLSSVYLSSPGSSTILKCDEFCKINSVWLNIYKLSFFTDTGKGIYFKFLVLRWGSWASKKTKKKKPTTCYLYWGIHGYFFYSAVSSRYQRRNLLQAVYLTTLLKMVFYSDKAWIALYVSMAHFVWVTLVGLLVLEIAFIFWTLGMANLEAVQDVWWDNLHLFIWKDSPVQLFHSGAGVLAFATCWKVEAPLCVYGALT